MKLTEEELKAKKKYHKSRVSYYCKKIESIKEEKSKIGFKYK